MACPVCGERFDCRNLEQVLDHWHEDDKTEVVVPSGRGLSEVNDRKVAERRQKNLRAHQLA